MDGRKLYKLGGVIMADGLLDYNGDIFYVEEF